MDKKNEVAKSEEKLTAAEQSLKNLKAKTTVKLGAIPFIAGTSEKAMGNPVEPE